MTSQAHQFQALTESDSDQLNSIRGISAIAVMIGHANQTLIAPNSTILVPWMGLLAQSAVMIFFVLSGFLIGKSISNNIIRNNGFSLSEYLITRGLRIWPPLLLSIAILFLLYHLAPYVFPSGTNLFQSAPGHSLARTAFDFDPISILGSLFFMNGFFVGDLYINTPNSNGPLWSLSVEVWYYVLAAIIAIPRGKLKLLTLPIVFVIIFWGRKNLDFLYYLPVWYSGYMLSQLHDHRFIPNEKHLVRGAFIFLMIAASIGTFYVIAFYLNNLAANNPMLIRYFNITFGFGFCAVLALTLRGDFSFPKTFRGSARYSYTLYIIHFPIMLFIFGMTQMWLQESIGAGILISSLTIFITIAISKYSAKLLEDRKTLISAIRAGWLRFQ
ncbi:acyltransferase family protein [Eoetvoesiella caeni]